MYQVLYTRSSFVCSIATTLELLLWLLLLDEMMLKKKEEESSSLVGKGTCLIHTHDQTLFPNEII
jgi:hypothetical protein